MKMGNMHTLVKILTSITMIKKTNILGIGTDIIAISRFAKSLSKHGDKFLDKIFTKKEQQYCKKYADSTPRFAARFSAKEAVSKALGTGFNELLSFLDIEITNDEKGKPHVILSDKVKNHFGSPSFEISLSHGKESATATVIALN